jgi:hypothetical protein
MKTRDVPEYDLMHMLLSAFRYALGSRTGIVGDTVAWVTRYWDILEPYHVQIKQDIEYAIQKNTVGTSNQKSQWETILALPS